MQSTFRELTAEELMLVAGGATDGSTITVTGPGTGGGWGDGGPPSDPWGPGGPPNEPIDSGGGGGDGGGQGETVPEIVVVGHQPPVTPLGNSGWSAQFYSDGVAVLRYMGGAPQEWNFTMDFGPNTQTATATVPPSISATNTGMTYHFTGLHTPDGTVRN